LAARGGTLDTALELAQAMLSQANEEDTKRAWQQRVQALTMEQDLRAIEATARRYRSDHGAFPPSVGSLAAAGYLPRVPQEPHGGRYVLSKDGTAGSTAAERLQVYGETARLEVH